MSVTAQARPAAAGLAASVRDYLSLLKLRIVSLLVATAVGAMFPAAGGWPRPLTILAVALGGTLAAGGAHAINCWFDKDIDAAMDRTRSRPIPDGRILAWHALVLGLALNVVAFAILTAWANLLAAALAIAGTLIYVFVYTVWLKRWTPQNIVIGGAAGAVPPLVGWAAVTGSLDLTAWSLFAVVFFWTPPHFWALAQLIRGDYAEAGVPMLPVVAGDQAAKRQSLAYSVIVLVVSTVPYLTGRAGLVYLIGAMILGAGLVALAALDLRGRRWTRPLFLYTIGYMGALFALLMAGALLGR